MTILRARPVTPRPRIRQGPPSQRFARDVRRGTPFAFSWSVALHIRLLEPTFPVDDAACSAGSSALNLAGAPDVFLRFAIQADDPEELEALRYARRSMLREEWTRGRDGDEPSLEEAIFSSADILWWIRPERRRWYLQRVEELAARANRRLAEREHS